MSFPYAVAFFPSQFPLNRSTVHVRPAPSCFLPSYPSPRLHVDRGMHSFVGWMKRYLRSDTNWSFRGDGFLSDNHLWYCWLIYAIVKMVFFCFFFLMCLTCFLCQNRYFIIRIDLWFISDSLNFFLYETVSCKTHSIPIWAVCELLVTQPLTSLNCY